MSLIRSANSSPALENKLGAFSTIIARGLIDLHVSSAALSMWILDAALHPRLAELLPIESPAHGGRAVTMSTCLRPGLSSPSNSTYGTSE